MKKRSWRVLACAATVVISIGCDSNDKKVSTSAEDEGIGKAPERKAEAKEPESKEEGKAGPHSTVDEATAKAAHGLSVDDAKRERFKKNAAEVKELLGSARKKASTGDWAGAVADYEKAVKLDDDNSHILGELGWAQYNAKDPDGAEHNIRLALRYEQDHLRRADLLYKLGLIEEDRGDYVAAKKHYDHSLRLQETADAKEHAEAISDKAAAACKDGACEKPDYPDLAKACEAMLARVHEQQGLTEHTADDEFTCDPAGVFKVALDGAEASEAVVLEIYGEHAGTSEEEYDLLVHIEGGWHWVGTLLDVENPHHGGIARTGEIMSFEAKELMPGSPGQEVLVHLELAESDVDFEDNIIYHDEHEAYVVCGISKGQHLCHEIPVRMYYEAEALDSEKETPHDLTTHEFKATAEFDGKGHVTVKGTGEVPKDFDGTHAIKDLPEPKGFVFLHDD